MYCYYEHHKDAHGKTVLTELRLSSYPNGSLAIRFNNSVENTHFELCKRILKSPPTGQRSYDDASKVWSYLGSYGELVIADMKKILESIGGKLNEIEVEDLQQQCLNGHIDLTRKRRNIRPEDFFYNTTPQGAAALTKEQLAVKLSTIMGVQALPGETSALKKLYRQAAMRLHPDRNNGDGTQMSDLNMYWRLYNA